MKYILFIPLLLIACKKEPVPEPSKPIEIINAYSYRLIGLTVTDTAELILNGATIDPQLGQSIIARPGDKLILNYVGNRKTDKTFNFAVWPVDNRGASVDRIVHSYSAKRIWAATYRYIKETTNGTENEAGRPYLDSVPIYDWKHQIKDTIILP